MDIIDMHTLGGARGYAIVAVDTATRKMYGRTMNTKTGDDIVDTVRDMLDDVVVPGADPPSMSPEVPTQLDMDFERGWTNNPEFDALLQEFGIQQRFKTDKYQPNNLAVIDNKIGWLKNYLRQRLTEEEEDGDNWEAYFDEALAASNGRAHKVLYGKAPDELYDAMGEPEEEAEVVLYGLEKQ